MGRSYNGTPILKVTRHRLEVLDIRFGKVMAWTTYGNSLEK